MFENDIARGLLVVGPLGMDVDDEEEEECDKDAWGVMFDEKSLG